MKRIINNTINNQKIVRDTLERDGAFPAKVGLCKRDGSIGRCCNMDLVGISENGFFIVRYTVRGKTDVMNCNKLTIEV